MSLSKAQRRALEDGVRHGDIGYSIHGQSAHGGFESTVRVLRRNGFIDDAGKITQKGRAAIAHAVQPPRRLKKHG